MSIKDLDPSTPSATASAGQGDDEFRALKTALQACFGNVDGPVKNGVAGALATDVQLTALFDRLLAVETGLGVGAGILGEVRLYHGVHGSWPAGWTLCDGTGGTPNMVGFFPQGATTITGMPTIFGSSTGGALAGSGSTGPQSGITTAIQPTSLSLAQLPAALNGAVAARMVTFSSGQDHSDTGRIAGGNPGNGTLAYTATPFQVSGVNGDSHTHALTGTMEHTHTIPGAGTPPFVAFYFIKYTG